MAEGGRERWGGGREGGRADGRGREGWGEGGREGGRGGRWQGGRAATLIACGVTARLIGGIRREHRCQHGRSVVQAGAAGSGAVGGVKPRQAWVDRAARAGTGAANEVLTSLSIQ